MRRLRFCKRCSKVFEADGKFGRVCDNCRISVGGWHVGSLKDKRSNIDTILNSNDWRYGKYDQKIKKKAA